MCVLHDVQHAIQLEIKSKFQFYDWKYKHIMMYDNFYRFDLV